LIILSLIVAAGFLIAFFWAVRNGQFDDSVTPSIRMLFDDGTQKIKNGSPEEPSTDNKTQDQ